MSESVSRSQRIIAGASGPVGKAYLKELVSAAGPNFDQSGLHLLLREPSAELAELYPQAKQHRWEAKDASADAAAALGAAIEGPVESLVYLPGTIRLKPFARLSDEDFIEDFQVNVLGAVRLLRIFEKALKDGGTLAAPSSVLLFSTVAVAQGMPFHSSIAASKGALEALVRTLAAEWAPKVRVNALAPSLTQTPLAAPLLNSEEKQKAMASRHPLGRVGEAEDLARAAFFLTHRVNSSWISGCVLPVDGGMGALRK